MANQKKRKAQQNRKKEFIGLLLIIIGILVLLSLLSYQSADGPNSSNKTEFKNWLGFVGAWISFFLYNYTIGYPALVLPFLIIYLGWSIIKQISLIPLAKRTGYILFFALSFSIAFALPKAIIEDGSSFSHEFNGMIGLFFAQTSQKYLGNIGSVVVLFAIMFLVFLSLLDISITDFLYRVSKEFKLIQNRLVAQWDKFYREQQLKRKLKTKERSTKSTKTESISSKENEMEPGISHVESERESSFNNQQNQKEVELTKDEVFSEDHFGLQFDMPSETPSETIIQKENGKEKEPEKIMPRTEVKSIPTNYQFPGLELLQEAKSINGETFKHQLLQEARTLEEKLAIYGIEAKVVQIHPGPLITQFEVEPAQGIKISKFFGIADDLAMVMRAKTIRILAPIPGKAVVGIEIPNRNPEIISFRRIINSDEYHSSKYKLPLALGVDTTGKVYLTDMVRMPHLLVAGSTGSGKSVCLNTIIASLLYKLSPQDLRLILIDPKKLELSEYADLRNHHLITLSEMNEEVITTPDNAITILGRVWQEMEDRFNKLARANVRTLEDYNNKVESGELQERFPNKEFEKLPYIVIIVDELADLLMVSGQEVEEPIGRLAHKSRAVGIHLIVATQRPSTDVITGAIKANFPCRIAFKVFSKTDSRVVLDVNGADQLLGRGDMLFQPPGQPAPIRLHSPLISNDEISSIINFISQQPMFPEYHLPDHQSDAIVEMPNGRKISAQRDPLFYEALKLIVRHQQGSISLLQRRLRVGYARAARIIDEMEQAGFVGAFDGSKARDVLVGEEELDEMGII